MKKVAIVIILFVLTSPFAQAQITPDLEKIYSCFPVPEENEVFYSTLDHSIFQHPEIKEIKAFRDIIQHQYLYWLGMPATFDDRLISYSRGVFGRKSAYEIMVFELVSPAETVAKLFNTGVIKETGKNISSNEVYLFPIKAGEERTIDYYLMIAGYDQIFMSNHPDMLEKMEQVRTGKLPSAVKDPRFAPFKGAATQPCFDFTLTSNTMVIKKQLLDVEDKEKKLEPDLRAIAGMKKMIAEGPQITFEYTAVEDGQYIYQRQEQYGSVEFAVRFMAYSLSKADRIRNIKGHRDYWDLRVAKTTWKRDDKMVIGRLVFDQLLIDKGRDYWSDRMEEDSGAEQ